MLGVPVLAGSSACALGEAAGWRRCSLDETPLKAKQFYAVIGLSMTIGMAMNGFGFNAVAMLFWSAALNGLLAPPLIPLVLLLTSDRAVMGDHSNTPLLRVLGWVTVAAMSSCAVASVIFRIVGSG